MMMKYGIALLMSSYVVIQYICHHTIYVVIQYTIYVTLQYTIYVIIELLQMEYIDDYTHYQAFIWVKFLHWDVWSHHLESIPEVLSWENGPLWLWYVWSCSWLGYGHLITKNQVWYSYINCDLKWLINCCLLNFK